jgi:hypothetical protein
LTIVSAIILVYASAKTLDEPFEPSVAVLGQLEIILILYSSIISYNYSYRIERGVVGYIFSMPINRRSFARNSILVEVMFPAVMIMVPSILVFELTFFSVNAFYMAFVAIMIMAEISFMVSTGRVLAALTKNGIMTFVLLFGMFYAFSSISFYLQPGSFPWLITGGLQSLITIHASVYYTELIALIFLISGALYEISFLMLTSLNLKSGK